MRRRCHLLFFGLGVLLAPCIEAGSYVVRWGDSYFQVAKRFNLNPIELQKLNHYKPLRPGQRLRLRPRPDEAKRVLKPKTYRLQPGDTWTTLSLRFRVPLGELTKLNPQLSNRFWAGATLLLPSSSEATEPSKPLDWLVPIRGVVSQAYAPKASIMNYGLLFRPERQMVRSSEKGVVRYVGVLRGYGRSVLIAHSPDTVSAYMGLNDTFKKEGESVRKGEPIGRSKRVLFFGVFEGGRPLNPKTLLHF